MSQSICGIVNVLKPPGMTSHDVVARVRRISGAKVGHTGTLDPLAAGVLVLALGGATRVSEFILQEDKTYRAEFILGLSTDSLDLEGELVSETSSASVQREDVEQVLRTLTGEIEMIPPMFSAVRHGGRKLYDLARQGQDVERPARTVQVFRFELLDFAPGHRARALCEVHCSKGTYIRSLAEMVGDRLGCGACLGFLLRTSQGDHRIEDSNTLEELSDRESIAARVVPLVRALPQIPAVSVDLAAAGVLANGNPVALPDDAAARPDLRPGGWAMVTCGENAVCLAEVSGEGAAKQLLPRRVFQ
ncbi:MAG: tRNA pseudouridine(55) synthase TruB [Armatimonadetes bacterium]|nr:tRNA pseudouridine(55) synthase TruB [Armatimonadota bacterium]